MIVHKDIIVFFLSFLKSVKIVRKTIIFKQKKILINTILQDRYNPCEVAV